MRGAIPLLPNMPSWYGAPLKQRIALAFISYMFIRVNDFWTGTQ
jgi:hypothetical protein